MASSQMNNLVTLVKRLEAATSRLEDVAASTMSQASSENDLIQPAAPSVPQVGVQPATPTPKNISAPLPASIEGFDSLINGDIRKFVKMSDGIGGVVSKQAAALMQTFAAERKFLIVTTKAKKPDISSPVYMQCLTELQAAIGQVSEIRESNRASPLFDHLSMIAEGIPMVGWVTVDRKPKDFVSEMYNAAQFYGNRVIKAYKEKDRSHVEWVQAFHAISKSLNIYIDEFFNEGLTWNNKDGIDAADALKQVEAGNIGAGSTTASSSAPAPPPPPPPPPAGGVPPPPPPPPPSSGGTSSGGAADMNAVFSELSKGEAVTKGLRKVDPSQQTHKNPSLRASSTVTAAPARSDSLTSTSSGGRGKSPVPARKPESMRAKKPPKKELEGNKWLLENFDSPAERLVELDASLQHSILITKCNNVTFRINGKANAITIDSSAKIGLVIDSLVSSVEVIKANKFEMQVIGNLPTISLDQVDGASLYLSKESLDVDILTSKCTSININTPGKDEDDDYMECPVPEQIRTKIVNGKAVSEVVEHAG